VKSLLTILCLRDFVATTHPVALRRPLVAFRVIVIVMTLVTGAASVWAVTRYEHKISSWATDLLRERKPRQTEIGFSTTSRLHAVFNPTASMRRALLIDGSRSARHIRAIAYETYQDRRWRPLLNERRFATPDPAQLWPPSAAKASADVEHLYVTRLIETADLVCLPLDALAIHCPEPVELDAMGVLRSHDEGANQEYDLLVLRRPNQQGPLCSTMDEGQRQRALTVPLDIDARVIELARKVAGSGDAASRAVAIQSHLRSRHLYSLSYDPGDGEPINDFILNQRAAHCQYFASAMVVMARAAGVPARYVSGYYAHEPAGDGLVVRERDAHAWAECYIDGPGWVTFDPTPASGRPDQLFPKPSQWRSLWEWLQDVPRRVRAWIAQNGKRALLGIAIIGAILVVSAWTWRFLRLRRGRPREVLRGYALPSRELLAAAKRFDRLLRSRGAACATDRTWREHLRAMPQSAPIDRSQCLDFVNAYDAARFGGANGDTLWRINALLDQLEQRANG